MRSNAARPAMSRKEMRRQAKERKKAEKDRKASKSMQPVEIDWSIPVEDPSANSEFEWADEPESTGERVPF